MTATMYSQRLRRDYIDSQLESRYGWLNYEKLPGGNSYREIAWDCKKHFGTAKALTAATIKNDVDWLRERAQLPDDEILSYGQNLLLPENFGKWRAEMFKDPATGLPYDTPEHQMAWFWVFVALATKQIIPDWVLQYLDIPPEVNNEILGGEHLLSFILLAPPRHGKTELAIHTIIWLICAFPNIRIIYIAGILSTSQDNLDLVRAELEQNEELIKYYGPFKDDEVRWNNKGFIVATRVLRAKSMTGLPQGKGSNIMSKDADLIVVDDPQDLDAAESETQTDRDVKWLTTQVMTRREPHTAFLGLGSHLPAVTGDMWSRVEEVAEEIGVGRHRLVITKLRAHNYEKCDINDPDHTKCVLWHKLRPYWFLEAQRAALGDMLYEAVFNQDPRQGRVDYFRQDVIRGRYIVGERNETTGFTNPPDLTNRDAGILDPRRNWKTDVSCCKMPVLLAIGFDPAASEDKRASESALTVLGGCPRCERRYVIDYWHARQSPELHAGTILQYVRAFRPQRVRVESNAYQKALSRDKDLTAGARQLGFLIDEWNTDEKKWDPVLGIPMVNRHIENGMFSVPYMNNGDQQYAEDYLKAFIRWPKKPNDIPMSTWLADLSVQQMIEEYKYVVPDVMPGWDELPDYLKDQTYDVELSEINGEGIFAVG
jgi:hypothetical protein